MTTQFISQEQSNLKQEEHYSLGLFGERGTGKSLYAVTQAVDVLRAGGRLYTNMDINPLTLPNVLFQPHLLHYDNSVVRLPDAPNQFSLNPKIVGDGWFIKNGVLSYSIVALDECAAYLNSRTWNDSERMQFISGLVHARKFGYREMFLAHSPSQLDSQVRQSYLTTIKILLRRPPQFWRRVFYNLGIARNPMVCTVSRDSDGDFPTDLADPKVWSRGLVKSDYYTTHNPTIWQLYKTRQIFDFKIFHEHTTPLLVDGASIFGLPVTNIFLAYHYVEHKTDSKGALKRPPKSFAFYRPGVYAVISPRLFYDCLYVQSKLHQQFLDYQTQYELSNCSAPAFNYVPVQSLNPVASHDSRFFLVGTVAFLIVIIALSYFLITNGYDLAQSTFFTTTPAPAPMPAAPPPVPAASSSNASESPPSLERFKKPAGARYATYPVCEFFNLLELDRVTYFDGKHMLDRDWLLQYFRSYPFKITNYFVDQATGMPRYSLMFYNRKNSSQPIDSASEIELFNYGWRSAVTGHNDSFLAIYNPNIWIFLPISSLTLMPNSRDPSIFTLPTLGQH